MMEGLAEVRSVPIGKRPDVTDVVADLTSKCDFDAFDAIVDQSAKLTIELVKAHDVIESGTGNEVVASYIFQSLVPFSVRVPVPAEAVVADSAQPLGSPRLFNRHSA